MRPPLDEETMTCDECDGTGYNDDDEEEEKDADS